MQAAPDPWANQIHLSKRSARSLILTRFILWRSFEVQRQPKFYDLIVEFYWDSLRFWFNILFRLYDHRNILHGISQKAPYKRKGLWSSSDNQVVQAGSFFNYPPKRLIAPRSGRSHDHSLYSVIGFNGFALFLPELLNIT